MTRAYYNEFDPFAAQWLRNLMAAGHIMPGDVDERSIRDVRPADLIGYTRCHFFAGIGGWDYALKLAGWPDGRPVWTGSCPCQPFSVAGKREGTAADRHLWPDFFRLIAELRPATVIGEQVEGAVRHGWLDLVFGDLEGEGYACGAAVLGAHSVGAPHIRQRLWWVADAERRGRESGAVTGSGAAAKLIAAGNVAGRVADAERDTAEQGRVAIRPGGRHEAESQRPYAEPGRRNGAGRLVLAHGARSPARDEATTAARHGRSVVAAGWDDFGWLPCIDGKARPTQPGLFPLAHGVPSRVGKLRAYGNAIVPQAGAEFMAAFLECAP